MKGILFDMDGVLIDAMPFHAEAVKIAIKEQTNTDIDKKIVYQTLSNYICIIIFNFEFYIKYLYHFYDFII